MPAVPMSAEEIAEDIASRIESGEYPPGHQLPSYAQLADLYSVSVSTAARAVRDLRVRRLIVGSRGRATYVADTPGT
jgi:GntR family transcriptional regulator